MSFRYFLPYVADARDYFRALIGLPWAVWLDSGGKGRYDILSAQPAMTLQTWKSHTTIASETGSWRSTRDPLELLRESLGEPSECEPEIPFRGGAIGYWGYDLARRWCALPGQAQDAENLPDMAVAIYDWALLIDHQSRTVSLVSDGRYPETASQLPAILARLQQPAAPARSVFSVTGKITSNFSRADYAQAFHAIADFLAEGDCYQVNLAQRFSAEAHGDALEAYLYLREISPAPYSAFLDWPGAQILSASPECFLRLQQGRVETRPIKGTRPRGEDAAQDAALAADLSANPKDRAENVMIVDLLRNDLGRCCEAGSVTVPRLFEVESHANVHHLVSTVTGTLAAGNDALSLLKNCFPGGSITGAPKRRAMEIIDALEPQRRGVYCGAIGYIGFDGNMDTSIVIRTLIFSGHEIRAWAGGGIVVDSNCEAEYQETLDKASALLQLLRRFGGQ